MTGENHRKKGAKKLYYIQSNFVTKKGGKRATQCFHKHRNSAAKTVAKKIYVKKFEKTVFIFTPIS